MLRVEQQSLMRRCSSRYGPVPSCLDHDDFVLEPKERTNAAKARLICNAQDSNNRRRRVDSIHFYL